MAPVLNIRVFDDCITIRPVGFGSGNVADDELLPDIFVRIVFLTNGSYQGHLTIRDLRDAEIEIPWPGVSCEHIVEFYAEEPPSGLFGELFHDSRSLVVRLADTGKQLLTILDARVNREGEEIQIEDLTHIQEEEEESET
ncbi:MAG: hypothetical protein QW734_03955 [Candidatus Bathyarchaeia archaeon]